MTLGRAYMHLTLAAQTRGHQRAVYALAARNIVVGVLKQIPEAEPLDLDDLYTMMNDEELVRVARQQVQWAASAKDISTGKAWELLAMADAALRVLVSRYQR